MRWFKISIFIFLFLMAVYAISMYFFVDESKSFKVEKQIGYPVEKVFPQFNSFQNFARWNNYFSSSNKISLDFYTPYEGKGASMSFFDKESGKKGEMYIRYSNQNHTIKYQLFEGKKSNPTLIDIKFISISGNRTKIVWYVHTPKQPLLKRSVNLWTEDDFVDNLDKSMASLNNVLGNKVDKDKQLENIKFDSLMVENQNANIILGINVTTQNKKDNLFKNIILNHNKVYNFVTNDLGKREDEIGFPILITNAANFKDREISYFYGIPLSKKIGVSDNNFSFRALNPSKSYTIYYKGNYAGISRSISLLQQRAKKDSMRSGDLQETFIETPTEGKDVVLKLSLPVYR